ncbi:MAG: alpha/beta hydrolase [Candidatus Saccharibacteria bacterium]|nr:alpha/beta hydrolase [Pseudorhodobacter sp.]
MTGTVLFAGDHLRAEVHNPDAEVLFVTFDRWRRDRDGFAGWAPSTRVAAAGFAELIIKTAQNDWYLNPDLAPLRRALKAYTGRFRTVRSFAFSMGAYAALLLSRSLRLRHAVLVSPQYSPFPGLTPGDTRYRREAQGLDRVLGDLAEVVAPKLRGVILFDPLSHPIDRAHARLILGQVPRMVGIAMPLAGHPATQVMLETAEYGKLRALAFAAETDPALYHALHVGARKASPLYQARLAERIDGRRARAGM